MLNVINKTYIIISFILYFVLSMNISERYLMINFYAVVSVITYFYTIYLTSIQKRYFYRYENLGIMVILYSLIFVALANFISYIYDKNFFVFSVSDALFYHSNVVKMSKMGFVKGVEYYLTFMEVDDLGMILILYPLYQIVQSNLIVNGFYLIVGVITAFGMFDLAKHFMSRRYAFLSSLSYSISSFTLFYHSSGLKESFMVMTVLLAVVFYYRFEDSKNIFILIVASIFWGLIFLFRPAVAYLLLGSIGLGTLFAIEGKKILKLFAFIGAITYVVIGGVASEHVDEYTNGGVDSLIEARESENMVIGGLGFTYAVNILSQTVGPIPTVLSPTKILTMFYTPGLIYRVMLSIPFWIGVFFIIKLKESTIYKIVLFTIFEMGALAFLMDGMELRVALPHIPYVFIVAFWFMYQYDSNIIIIKRKRLFKSFFFSSISMLTLIILGWNMR